jgi:hypothetical protein
LNALGIIVGGGPGRLARWRASGFVAERFGLTFHEMVKGGLITLEKVKVIDYRADPDLPAPPEI